MQPFALEVAHTSGAVLPKGRSGRALPLLLVLLVALDTPRGCAALWTPAGRSSSNLTSKAVAPTLARARRTSDIAHLANESQLLGRELPDLPLFHTTTPEPAIQPACRESVLKHPKAIQCPSHCAFLRVDPIDMCSFTCVPPHRCGADDPKASFPDPETKRCARCKVAACAMCGNNSRTCAVCQEGWSLSHGRCVDEKRVVWWLFYTFLFVAGGLVLTYLVTLALRPITNSNVLKNALLFRRHSQIKDESTGEVYPFCRTHLRTEYVAGVGLMLHFNFQWWAAGYTLVVLCILYYLSVYFGSPPTIMGVELDDNAYFEACNANVRKQAAHIGFQESIYFCTVLVLYVFTTAACILFAVRQRRTAAKVSQQMTTMQDYAILVKGLPKMPGTQRVEEDIFALVKEGLAGVDAEIVGVSVCWDFRTCVEQITTQAKWELEQRELLRERLIQENFNELGPRLSARGIHLPDALMKVDEIFGVGQAEDPDDIGPKDRGPKEVRALLESLYSSGKAYVVFRTERQRNTAYKHLVARPINVRNHRVEVEMQDAEPETVLWQNFGIKPGRVIFNIAIGIALGVWGVFLLDVLFYFPSVAYLLSVSDVAGMSQGGFQGTLLGLLVCCSNQSIYAMIGFLADMCGFVSTDTHQKFYVVGYTAAVFINTIVDLFVVLLLAQGYSMEQAMYAKHDNDSSMSVRAIVENPAMQVTVYVKFTEYLFPSCLLVPYLGEAVALYGILLIKRWIVGSRSDVSVQEAEDLLRYPPFDLSRYGDILICVMLCICTLAFTYNDIYWLWFYLLGSQVWIYIWDKWRFLRVSSKSVFVSSSLEETAQYLSSVPCGLIAACLVFRVYGQKNGRGYGFLESLFDQVEKRYPIIHLVYNRDTVMLYMALAIVLHIIAHCWVLDNLVPKWACPKDDEEHDLDVDWSTTASELPCNWFNANPVHSLRSKYIYDHQPPCWPYAQGREYILEANPEVGCFYNKQERGLLDADSPTDWKGVFQQASLGLVEEGRHMVEAMRSFTPKHTPTGGSQGGQKEPRTMAASMSGD